MKKLESGTSARGRGEALTGAKVTETADKYREKQVLLFPAVQDPRNTLDWQNLRRTPVLRETCGLQSSRLSLRSTVKSSGFGAETQGFPASQAGCAGKHVQGLSPTSEASSQVCERPAC